MANANPKSVPVPAEHHTPPVLSQAPAVGFAVHAAEEAYKPSVDEFTRLDSKEQP